MGVRLPDRVVAMVRRLPPATAPVVPGSTPVVAFGDPATAEVATLGINPSRVEFVEDGSMLSGDRRRLSTLDSLGVASLTDLSDEQAATVVADCAGYFRRNPYRAWFDPLDAVVRAATGASYYEGTACHLDLVQWATDPVWSRITDGAVRQALLADGVPHLRAQLANEDVRLVLLNGRQVLTQAVDSGLVSLVEFDRIEVGTVRHRLFAGESSGVRWVGWSTNLQSSWGVSAAFRTELAARVKSLVTPTLERNVPAAGHVDAGLDGAGHLPRGMRLTGKRQLVATLARWLSQTSAPTIGDVGAYGGHAWVFVDLDGQQVVLNADTKRAAVDTFVRDSTPDPTRPWSVIANSRGRVNKVLPNPAGDPLPGWYAYLTRPWPQPGRL